MSCGQRDGVRLCVAECARCGSAVRRAGRSGPAQRAADPQSCRRRSAAHGPGNRSRVEGRRYRSRAELCRSGAGAEFAGVGGPPRAARADHSRAAIGGASGEPVRDRLPHRRYRRPRELLRNRRRRSVRLWRYPRRRRPGQAPCGRRRGGSAGARPRRGRACGDGRHVRFRRHGEPGARRTDPVQGRAQKRTPQRRPDRLGAAVRDRGRRFQDAAAGG